MPSLPDFPDYERWSPQDLQQAEQAAMEFLDENIGGIVETFDQRIALMRRVSRLLSCGELNFEDRMMYLSLMQEIALSVSDSAGDFFDIVSGPRVAKLIRQA